MTKRHTLNSPQVSQAVAELHAAERKLLVLLGYTHSQYGWIPPGGGSVLTQRAAVDQGLKSVVRNTLLEDSS